MFAEAVHGHKSFTFSTVYHVHHGGCVSEGGGGVSEYENRPIHTRFAGVATYLAPRMCENNVIQFVQYYWSANISQRRPAAVLVTL